MRNPVIVLALALVAAVFVCSYSPETAALKQIDESSDLVTTVVEDKSDDCRQWERNYSYWICHSLQCWAEYVVGGCSLSTDDMWGQSGGVRAFVELNGVLEEDDFQSLPAHLYMVDESEMVKKVNRARAWAPWWEICGPYCQAEDRIEAIHKSFLGCQLRLEACGQRYNDEQYFPGYLFDHCRRDGHLLSLKTFCPFGEEKR